MFIWTVQDVVGLVLIAAVALYFLGMFAYFTGMQLYYKIKRSFSAKR